MCADASNPLGKSKKCFQSREDDDACLSKEAGEPRKCHDKAHNCKAMSWMHRNWNPDFQKAMHKCCPVTCDLCGCGLSEESCGDCDDNSDRCLKAQDEKWKGHDCESAVGWCDNHEWGKHVNKCCPGVCKKSEKVAMRCDTNSDTCLQRKRHWGGGQVCNDDQSKKYCQKDSTPWWHTMWGLNWQYDMFTCCPQTCKNEGVDISWAMCNEVAASKTCKL